MATQTSKARDRAVARTLQAAEQMAQAAPTPSLPRCPECGSNKGQGCCWYSRRVGSIDQAGPVEARP